MIYHAPALLNTIPGITAGVSYAKREKFSTSSDIPGLNFGENTGISLAKVNQNIQKLNKETGYTGQFALAEQVHGAEVSVVNKPGYYREIDGLITSESDLMIGIKIADCAALLFADPVSGIIAAIHAGWRGAASGIVLNAVQQLMHVGANTKNILVYISPCISLQNLEIGEEVAEQFPSKYFDRTIGPKPHLDLKQFLVNQLRDGGIESKNIDVDSRCTFDDTSFYSFRRERDGAGRMLAFIKQSIN